jgi:hypothetical protein
LIVLEKNPELAEPVHEVTSQLANSTQEYATLSVAVQRVKDMVAARESFIARPPAQKVVIMALITAIEERAEHYLRKQGVAAPTEVKAWVQEIAGWIRDSSALYMN